MEPDGYAQIQAQQIDVAPLFDGAGITLNELPINAQVWALARSLMENIFLNVQDCLVYASAIIGQATELITADGYLHGTVCWTNNPGRAPPELNARFISVKAAVLNSCADILGWEVDRVVVPLEIGNAYIRQFLNEANP